MLNLRQFASVELRPGTLYGALARLEEEGMIEPRPYRLTPPGAQVVRGSAGGAGEHGHSGMERQAQGND